MIVPHFEQNRPVILRDEQRDPTVLALEQISRRIMLVLASGALHHPSFGRIVERNMLMERHARLDRGIDPCADAASLALPERQHYAIAREQAGVVIGLGLGWIAWRHRRIAADKEQAAHGITDDVGSLVVSVRTILAKAGQRNQD